MNAPPPGPIATLPVSATVAATYRTFFGQLRYLPRAMAVPFLLSILLWIATLMVVQLATLFALLSLVPYTIFGVTWYRLNLMGPNAGAPVIGFQWQSQHWRFLRYVILVMLANIVVIQLAMAPIMVSAEGAAGASMGGALFTLIALIGLGYVLVRISFVFPAAAVGEQYGFKHAWRHSVGQGWRLLLGLFFVLLPLIALMAFIAPIIVAPFLDPAPATTPAAPDMAQAEELGAALARFQLISLIFEYPLLALTMTYVSIAFQTCTGWVADHGNLPATRPEPDDGGDDGA